MKLFRLVIPILAGLAMAVGAVTALARSQPAPASPPVPLAFETDLTASGVPEDTGGAENMHADASGRLWISQESENNANVRVFDPATHAYTLYTGLNGPHDAQSGPDGNVWFYLDSTNVIARMDPASGIVTTWGAPVLGISGLAFDDSGNVWALTNNEFNPSDPGLSLFNIHNNQVCTMTLPNNGGGGSEGSFVTAHDGALWMNDAVNTGLARITPTIGVSPTYTFWPISANGIISPAPGGVAFAPNGVVWFSDELSGTIGRLETGANRVTLFNAPGGNNTQKLDYFLGKVWFTAHTDVDNAGGTIGNLDPTMATSAASLVVAPATAALTPVCVDAGAGITFTAGISTGVSTLSPLALTTTVDAQGISYVMPISGQPAALVRFGSNFWLTDQGRNKLVEVIAPTTLYLPLMQR